MLAVAAALSCMSVLGSVNYTKAGANLQVNLAVLNNVYPGEPVTIREYLPRFVQRWWEHWVKNGNVDDEQRSGRPPLIPDGVARHAAEVLCRGYTVTTMVDGRQVQHRKYYTTLPEAIAANEELKGVLQDFSVTPNQLLQAMHRVAPEIEQRRVHFRHLLTPEEMEHRSSVANGLRARCQTDTTLLDRMLFIDETTFLTHGLKREHIVVWVNSTDPGFMDFTGVPGKAGEPVKAHVIAAVSAHPAFQDKNGLVYFDFTTGTSYIKRLHNKRLDGSTTTAQFEYTVSDVTLGK
jgi:hypothetical protein